MASKLISSEINALFHLAFGRNATKAELSYWTGKQKSSLTDSLGKSGNTSADFKKTYSGAKGSTAPTKYTGNNGQWGELPKQDPTGKYSWVDKDGVRHQEAGFNLNGTTGWEYLGEHPSGEWSTASTMYKNTDHTALEQLDKPWTDLSPEEKSKFLNDATVQLASKFVSDIGSGQSQLADEAGKAVTKFADSIKDAGLSLDSRISQFQSSLASAGLTFSGSSKDALGEGFSAVGNLTPEQRATLTSNLATIRDLPNTVTTGSTPTLPELPTPKKEDGTDYTTAEWDALPQDQKESAYERSPGWADYNDKIQALSVSGTGTGSAGTGTYGFNGNLDAFLGTGVGESGQGKIFRNAGSGFTDVVTSARADYNSRARELGSTFEGLLGTSNILSMSLPTIGGQSIINPAANVLGSLQSGFQSNRSSAAGSAYGDALSKIAYTFPTSL